MFRMMLSLVFLLWATSFAWANDADVESSDETEVGVEDWESAIKGRGARSALEVAAQKELKRKLSFFMYCLK